MEREWGIVKNKIAVSQDYFYLFGWLPVSQLNLFKNRMKAFGDKVKIIVKNNDEINTDTLPQVQHRFFSR